MSSESSYSWCPHLVPNSPGTHGNCPYLLVGSSASGSPCGSVQVLRFAMEWSSTAQSMEMLAVDGVSHVLLGERERTLGGWFCTASPLGERQRVESSRASEGLIRLSAPCFSDRSRSYPILHLLIPRVWIAIWTRCSVLSLLRVFTV